MELKGKGVARGRAGWILLAAGLLTLASLAATSGTSWMLPVVLKHYGEAGQYLTSVPPFASALGLLVTPFLARWLTPARTIAGGFTVMAAAFAVMVTMPPLPIALMASAAVGLVAVGIGSVHAAAPRRAGVDPSEASSVILAVFTGGSVAASYGVAKVATTFGAAGAFAALTGAMVTAAVGAWLLFGRGPAPSDAAAQSPRGLRHAWTGNTVAVAFLAAMSKIAVGAYLATVATLLVKADFADPGWLGLAQVTALPAAIVLVTWWRRRSPKWADNGLTKAAVINLAASVALVPTIWLDGLWWLIPLLVGLFGYFVGAAYEAGSYAALDDHQGGKKTVVNFGIALGFAAGVQLGNMAVFTFKVSPVVVALPAAIVSLAITLVARPWVRRWVAAARGSDTQQQEPTLQPEAPATPEPLARIVAPEPQALIVAPEPASSSFDWFDDCSQVPFVDADLTGAPDEMLTTIDALLQQRSGSRPDAFLMRVVSAVAPRPGDVERFTGIDLKAELAADVERIPGIDAVRGVRVQDGLADGPTAIVTVELDGGTSLEQLRERARFVATRFAAVAPIDGEPFARVVLAVRVECARVERMLGADPLVDVGLRAGTSALSRPYHVGRELAALWEHRTLAGVRVVLAERQTPGDPREDAALFVHHGAIGAQQLGGARPEGEPSPFDGGVFVPVAAQDAAAADRTADLLSGVLRRVGTVALGVPLRVAPAIQAASPS